jgi:hypothetical protein
MQFAAQIVWFVEYQQIAVVEAAAASFPVLALLSRRRRRAETEVQALHPPSNESRAI